MRAPPARVGVALLVCAFGCAAAGSPEPGASAIPAGLESVAVVPVSFPDGLAGAPALGRRLERGAQSALQRAGFRVLPAAVASAIRDRMAREMGGLRDGSSGSLDAQKLEVLEEYSTRELLGDHGPDALLRLELMPESVRMDHGKLVWDGPEADLCAEDRYVDRLRCRQALGGGSVPGLVLRARLEGRGGVALYARTAGVQVMVERGSAGTLRPVPPVLLRVDPEALRTALASVLEPLNRP